MKRVYLSFVAGGLVLFAVAAFWARPVLGQAQTPAGANPGPAQGVPSVTFQAEVTYVDVDTRVTDEKGNFIDDLKKEDFQVFEDGKLQKIDTFSLVELPVERQDRFLALGRPVSSGVRTNRQPFTGRMYVIVLDDLDISPMRTSHVRKFAREFVEKYFGANDLAAVVYTSGRTDGSQEFTSDPQLLLAAIDKLIGRRLRSLTLDRIDEYYTKLITASSSNEETQSGMTTIGDQRSARTDAGDLERGQRAFSVLSTLKNISDFMATVRGRRKGVLFFSEGIDYPLEDVFGARSAGDVIRSTQDAISAAARANVNYFTLDPRGLMGMSSEFIEMQGSGMPEVIGNGQPDSAGGKGTATVTPFNGQKDFMAEMRVSQDSLRALAEETGGIAAVNANSLTETFERIVEGNSRYYVLGYYPPSHPRDGRFHKIEVRVRRQGLKVTARKGYASPRGKTSEERKRDDEAKLAREARKPLADNTSPALREVLGNPIQQSGLTLTVQAAPFRNTKSDASVALTVEVDGDRLPFTQQATGLYGNQLEVSYFNVTEEGKAQKGVRAMLNLHIRPETLQRVKAAGVRANSRIVLRPGRYQLRVGAREEQTGQSGTVFYDLQVPDFTKQSIMMGGLLLSAPSAQQTFTAVADEAVAKLLPGAPTSRREFTQSDTLSLLTEIYDNDSSRSLRNVDIAVRLTSETGTEAFAAKDSIANGGADSKQNWDAYTFTKSIPLAGVPAGRYLVRVEAQARGNTKDRPAAAETVITVR